MRSTTKAAVQPRNTFGTCSKVSLGQEASRDSEDVCYGVEGGTHPEGKMAVVALSIPLAIPASATAELNDKNCVGWALSDATPEDFHHGAEALRAVPQAEDGRGDEITSFTSFFAGCKGL
jgi:hypothetical protein